MCVWRSTFPTTHGHSASSHCTTLKPPSHCQCFRCSAAVTSSSTAAGRWWRPAVVQSAALCGNMPGRHSWVTTRPLRSSSGQWRNCYSRQHRRTCIYTSSLLRAGPVWSWPASRRPLSSISRHFSSGTDRSVLPALQFTRFGQFLVFACERVFVFLKNMYVFTAESIRVSWGASSEHSSHSPNVGIETVTAVMLISTENTTLPQGKSVPKSA